MITFPLSLVFFSRVLKKHTDSPYDSEFVQKHKSYLHAHAYIIIIESVLFSTGHVFYFLVFPRGTSESEYTGFTLLALQTVILLAFTLSRFSEPRSLHSMCCIRFQSRSSFD